jgi:hypothetical protein
VAEGPYRKELAIIIRAVNSRDEDPPRRKIEGLALGCAGAITRPGGEGEGALDRVPANCRLPIGDFREIGNASIKNHRVPRDFGSDEALSAASR